MTIQHAKTAGLCASVRQSPGNSLFSHTFTERQRKTAGAFGGHTGGGYQKATAEVCHSAANNASISGAVCIIKHRLIRLAAWLALVFGGVA